MIGDLATWQRLMDPAMEGLRAAAAGGSGMGVAEISRLRKGYSPELVAAAIELAVARQRAAAKFGTEVAARLVADRVGVEMASSAAVARHKAGRFAGSVAEDESVVDLCCGIGGDAMALREAGLEVVGVDANPVRAWMCGVNAGCRGLCAQAEDIGARWFHLDPSRRIEGAGSRRVFGLEELSPGPAVWRAAIERARGPIRIGEGGQEPGGGAIKLGPGVDVAEVREAIGRDVPLEVEYISENGRMMQAVAWAGVLAGESSVRATAIIDGHVYTIAGEAGDPPIGAIGRYLIETDPSIERAGLLGSVCEKMGMHGFCPGLGLLTGDIPAAEPRFASFAILAHMPWNIRQVRAWLREHDGGIVEVKTRGGAVEPDSLHAALRGKRGTIYTVFVLRIGRAIKAFITRREERPVR